MPFSHHSHSGQFCGHAKNTLEDVIKTAIAKRFEMFALTEHIPRPKEDFYPEEEPDHTEQSLAELFDAYVIEAFRLRDKYAANIKIMVGFETEWIRPSTRVIIYQILEKYQGDFDFLIGSIHHVETIPIDFDDAMYNAAKERAGGTDEKLFEKFFDEQEDMLTTLRPPIVGHLDLIRLKSFNPDTEFEGMEGVWQKIHRNLKIISAYGGILELNSAALRKGLKQPYPSARICKMFLSMNGRFALSDDSHGLDQVATNYPRLLDFIKNVGIKEIWYASYDTPPGDARFKAGFTSISVDNLEKKSFWAPDS